MTETGKLILKLALLIVPAIVVLCTLYVGQKGDGIGGGGYDLSELVYSGAFTLFVAAWNVWILVSLLMAKNDAAKQNNQILLVIGLVALVATVIWFFKQLN